MTRWQAEDSQTGFFYHSIFRLLIPRFNGAREYDIANVSIKKLHRCIRIASLHGARIVGQAGISESSRRITREEKSPCIFQRGNCIEKNIPLLSPFLFRTRSDHTPRRPFHRGHHFFSMQFVVPS